eukprot:332260_1
MVGRLKKSLHQCLCSCMLSHVQRYYTFRTNYGTTTKQHVMRAQKNNIGQQIIKIIKQNKTHSHNMDHNHTIIQKVFTIYNNTSPTHHNNDFSVNAVLKACIHFNHSSKVFGNPFWNDIENRINNPNNTVSYPLLLKCCIKSHDFERGKQLISQLKLSASQDPYIKTVLMDFYGHFGDVMTAKLIFDGIPRNQKDAVCIGSMMKVFLINSFVPQSLSLYDQYSDMCNEVCDLLAIKACMKVHNITRAKAIHQLIQSKGKFQSVSLKTTLIDFYGTIGDLDTAQQIFDGIDNKSKDIWCVGSMLEALYHNKQYNQCFELFDQMTALNAKLKPNLACYSIILKNCTQTTAYYIGKKVHKQLLMDEHDQWILKDVQIRTKLIHFYGKCGDIEVCESIFEDIKCDSYEIYERDIGIWNAMVTAFGRNGEMMKVKQLYKDMKMNGSICKYMDRKLYILLIQACGHCDDVMFAKEIWNDDIRNDEIKYDSYVVTSAVDCFARKGLIQEARNIIVKYESFKQTKAVHTDTENDRIMWMSLLSGARNTKDSELANQIYEQMKSKFKNMTQKELGAASVLLSNVYGVKFDVDKLDTLLKQKASRS